MPISLPYDIDYAYYTADIQRIYSIQAQKIPNIVFDNIHNVRVFGRGSTLSELLCPSRTDINRYMSTAHGHSLYNSISFNNNYVLINNINKSNINSCAAGQLAGGLYAWIDRALPGVV